MKVSTKGRYAMRVMLDLAENGGDGGFVSLKGIAERQEISVKYLEQIISVLLKAGYVESARGSTGGYRLAKKPEEYTFGDILRAAEGSLVPVSCAEESRCTRSKRYRVCKYWKGLYEVINRYIDSVTLAEIMQNTPS